VILAGQLSDKTNDFITSQFLGPARRPGRDGFGRSRIRSDRRAANPVQYLLGVSAETLVHVFTSRFRGNAAPNAFRGEPAPSLWAEERCLVMLSGQSVRLFVNECRGLGALGSRACGRVRYPGTNSG
jgi:hypothetical protein